MILPWAFGGAFFVFLIVPYMRGIPKELDEAAMIDGCSKIGILFKILVPVVQPAIVSAAIFAFYWIWQDFFLPLIFVGSPKNYTITAACLPCRSSRCFRSFLCLSNSRNIW